MSREKIHTELFSRIKELRTLLGFSQKEMANKLGIAISTYQYYERGERIPPSDFIAKIMTTFEVNSEWLLVGDGPMFRQEKGAKLDDITWRIMELLKGMTVEQKKEFLHSIEKEKLLHELLEERRKKEAV